MVKNIQLENALIFYADKIADEIDSTNSESLKSKLQAKFKLIDLLFKGYDTKNLNGKSINFNIPDSFKIFLENHLRAICKILESNCNLFEFVKNEEKIKKFANELYRKVKIFEVKQKSDLRGGHTKSKKVF